MSSSTPACLMKRKSSKLRISNNYLVKLHQATIYLCAAVGLYQYFDWQLLLAGLGAGWALFLFGVSCSLHKHISHQSYQPRTTVIKACLLLAGTLCALGSPVCWASTHRLHHRHTDMEGDPHAPNGSFFHDVKLWFYYFPPHSVRMVNDLMRDPMHRWFHRHYFHIHIAVIVTLAMINIEWLIYFYCVPIIYVMSCIGWITVCDHLPSIMAKFWREYDTPDNTYNSRLLALLLPGEGYHNTHHAKPHQWDTGPWDVSAPIIQLIKR